MNRQQQRERGVIFTQTITHRDTGQLYWFETTVGFSFEENGVPPDAVLHGPFRTHAEVEESKRLILLGDRNAKVIEGGTWDPNWWEKEK
jgi:hypothetical protein